MMTKDEAIKALRQCRTCARWGCYVTCDHCWVDAHRCPPTVECALRLLNRAVEIGREAQTIAKKLGMKS